MKKPKFFVSFGAVLIAALIVSGCNHTPSHTPVSDIEINAPNGAESLSFTSTDGGDTFTPASIQLSVTASPAGASNAVTWSVLPDDNSIVTVVNGLVRPVAGTSGGTVSITATSEEDEDIFDTMSVTVEVSDDTEPPDSITIMGVPGGATSLSFTSADGGNTFSPAPIQLTIDPDPETASKSVTWSVDPAGVVTVVNGTVTPVAAGDATITATSAVSKEDGTKAENTINVTVTVNGGSGTGELVVYNQKTDTGTTTNLATAYDNGTKRYTIKNASSTAVIQGGTAPAVGQMGGIGGVVDATIVYFDTPLSGTSQSVSARVRMTERGSSSGTKGVLMGLMTDPKGENIFFTGIRGTTNAYWRAYHSRLATSGTGGAVSGGTNNSVILTGTGYAETPQASGTAAPSLIDEVAIPFDEEFIFEFNRTGANGFTVTLKDYAGNTIASANRSGNTNDVNIANGYLGFIVANATVEISQITMKNGSTDVFSTDASTPTPTPVASLVFTEPEEIEPDSEADTYKYTHSTAGSQNDLEITAQALPKRANPTISWAVTGAGASLNPDTGETTTVTLPDTGDAAVTVAAGGKSATLNITATNQAISVQTITISAEDDKDTIIAGSTTAGEEADPQELQFSAEVSPHNAAVKDVKWSVANDSTYVADQLTATGGTIDADSGVLTAANDLADVTSISIWVFATATDDSVHSEGLEITVKKYVVILVDEITITAPGNSVMAGSADPAAEPKTLQFTPTVLPVDARNKDVTWSVSASSTFSTDTEVTDVASIDATSGLLTAGTDLDNDTDIWVFAAATDGSNVQSEGVKITVTPYDPTIFSWTPNATDTITNNSNAQIFKGITVIRGGGQYVADAESLRITGGGRFTFGKPASATFNSGTNTANNRYVTNGELDFSRKASITIVYTTGTGNFTLYLQNDQTGGGASVFTQNELINETPVAGGGTYTVTIDPAVLTLTTQAVTANVDKEDALKNAFLQFRCQNGGTLTITSIKIEYVE